MDRSFDLIAGGLKHFGGPSDQRIQSRGDDLFGRNVLDEQQHPGTQRVVQADVDARSGESLLRDFEYPLAISPRIGAGLAKSGFETLAAI